MLDTLARFVVRRRVAVLVVALLAMVVAGAVGGGVAKHLSGGGFDDPGAESSSARRTLQAAFGQRTPNLVLLVTSADGSVDSPAAVAAHATGRSRCGMPAVSETCSNANGTAPSRMIAIHHSSGRCGLTCAS